MDVLDDGYRWRKYGQKFIQGNLKPRYPSLFSLFKTMFVYMDYDTHYCYGFFNLAEIIIEVVLLDRFIVDNSNKVWN